MWAAKNARRERTAFGMVGGILLLQVLKWAYAGPNPLVASWWGLVFLGIFPGVWTALLVLSEDVAEAEGGELQSFLEEDSDVELEDISEDNPLHFDQVDSWRYADMNSDSSSGQVEVRAHNYVPVTSETLGSLVDSKSSNGDCHLNHEDKEVVGSVSKWTNGCHQKAANIGADQIGGSIDKERTSEEQDQVDMPGHNDIFEEPDSGKNGRGNKEQEKRVKETMEPTSKRFSKDGIDHKFPYWSGGFGVDAFREARTDSGISEYLDSPIYSETKDKTPEIQADPVAINNISLKNSRWEEGKEVPWLVDIKSYSNITDSEVVTFRHRDTKWNVSSCIRTAQRGIWSGSLLFITHWILTAPTSFSRWEGTTVEHGWVSVVALTVGLLAATEYPRLICLRRTQGLVFWLLIALGSMLFMVYPDASMHGAALIAFSAPSLWISISHYNLEAYPGSGLGIMVLVYISFTIWETCLVAYQSVSQLSFLRGSRPILMGCAITGIGLGVGREALVALRERRERDTDAPRGTIKGPSGSESEIPGRQAVGALISVVTLIGFVALAVRGSHSTPKSLQVIGGGPLKVLNFNLQQGFSRSGTVNYDTVLKMLRREKPHVVMFQESDMMHIVHGNLDTIDYLSTWLRMHSLYTPPTNSDTWGCAMLSFFPFDVSNSKVLASPRGENACFQHAQIQFGGKSVHLLNTHYGTLPSDIAEQSLEVGYMVKDILFENPHSFIVLGGDINSEPLSSNYNITLSSGLLHDAYATANGGEAYHRDPGAGYIFSSLNLNCTKFEEPHYDQQKTADGFPVVATFVFGS